MLITLLYGSCTGDDNNREYDRPEARAVSSKPLKRLSKIVPATCAGMASSWDAERSTASNSLIRVEPVHGADVQEEGRNGKKPRNA